MSFGERIKQARIEKGIQQGELAEKVGLSQATISRIEAGKDYPRFRKMVVILEAVGLEIKIVRQAHWY